MRFWRPHDHVDCNAKISRKLSLKRKNQPPITIATQGISSHIFKPKRFKKIVVSPASIDVQ